MTPAKILPAILLCLLPFGLLAATQEEQGLAIAQEADMRDSGYKNYTNDVKMILKNKQGQESIREIRSKTLEVDDDGDKSMTIFDKPRDIKGTALLSFTHKEGADDDGFFFFINEPHCKGFEEDADWTVAEWREDQGVDLRDEINREWTDLVVRKRSFPPSIKLTEKAKQMFFLVSYDIDKFKEFVFESSFLKRYAVDEATVEKIKHDEIELLKFGLEWLKSVLFKEIDPEEQAANAANQ